MPDGRAGRQYKQKPASCWLRRFGGRNFTQNMRLVRSRIASHHPMTRLTTLKPQLAKLPPLLRPATVRATVRTTGNTWLAIRRRILSRDFGLCLICRDAGRVTLATEIDHIIPLHLGGTDDSANLASVCKPCHLEKSRKEGTLRT